MNGNYNGEREVVEKARGVLDRSVTELDIRTVEKLRQIRLVAIEEAAPGKAHWFAVRRWAMAGGIAAFVVLVVAVSLWINAPRQIQMAGQMEDIEILTSQEHLDIYEDMEFYRWLASK
jgi:hypothetical protein